MADEQPIGADDVARKQFATAFRGFDQYEVRAFLAQVAAEMASLHERERALRERLAAAEEKPVPRAPVGEEELEAALGAETTRVLHAAREAAAEIRAKAEESVARMLREANDEASKLRGESETVLARRTEEAEAEAAAILRAAEDAATTMRADAEAAATAAVEEAQARGKEMLAEAQAVRERVLKDLARRRKAAASQLEQLLAGRERLLAAYEVVKENVELTYRELQVAEDEARLAAEVARFKAPADADEEPEAEPAATPEVPDVVAPAPVADTEPAPSAASEPRPDPEPEPEERRSSSLRLLRRKPEPADMALPEDDIEGVRILRPGAEPRPAAVTELRAVEAPVAEPAPAPEPEPEPELPAEAPAEDAPAAPVAPAAEEAAEVREAGPASEGRPVDDLFARLRADREKAVARAEAVLADSPVAVLEVEQAPEPEPEVIEPAGEAVFEARDRAIEPAERALTRALKRALADEQNEVLDALRRLRGTPTTDVLLPAAADHVARYAAVAGEHLSAGAEAGAAWLGGTAPAVDELASSFGAEVTEELRMRLARAFDASGSDHEALVETISATYREWKTARSESLARHHVAAAYAAGTFAAAAPDEPLRWVVDEAEGGCPDCDDNALAGPTPKGQPYPTGQRHPPAHAGCRCLVLPTT